VAPDADAHCSAFSQANRIQEHWAAQQMLTNPRIFPKVPAPPPPPPSRQQSDHSLAHCACIRCCCGSKPRWLSCGHLAATSQRSDLALAL
jgi:hypothetical protein